MKYLLIVVGLTGTLISGFFFLFACLCFLGIAADVSLAENREFGVQFFLMGLPFCGAGLLLLLIAWITPSKPKGEEASQVD